MRRRAWRSPRSTRSPQDNRSTFRSRRLAPVATIDDAIELLTDPQFRAGEAVGGFAPMRGAEIVEELRRRDASEDEARKLVRDALRKLRGLDKSHEQRGGGKAGERQRQQWIDDFWVPRTSLRKGSS